MWEATGLGTLVVLLLLRGFFVQSTFFKTFEGLQTAFLLIAVKADSVDFSIEAFRRDVVEQEVLRGGVQSPARRSTHGGLV